MTIYHVVINVKLLRTTNNICIGYPSDSSSLQKYMVIILYSHITHTPPPIQIKPSIPDQWVDNFTIEEQLHYGQHNNLFSLYPVTVIYLFSC